MSKASDHSGLDSEFEHQAVPQSHRHSLASVAAVWFGFPMVLTNAVFGGIIAYNLGFWPSILAIAIGNAVLLVYVGTLSYISGSTGYNFALQAEHTFGKYGYVITSGFLSSVVVGWYAFQVGLTGTTVHTSYGWSGAGTMIFSTILYTGVTFIGIRALEIIGIIAAPFYLILGIVAVVLIAATHPLSDILNYEGAGAKSVLSMGSAVTFVVAAFADSGTMTADFTRWAKDGRSGFWAAFSAFPCANMTAQLFGVVIVCAGAAVNPATSGGDFLPVLTSHGGFLSAITLLFVFVNLGSVAMHCLYNGAVGWSRIGGMKMRVMTIGLGILGGIAAIAGIWNHLLDWLNLLGVFVPPIGAIIIVDQLVVRHYSNTEVAPNFRPSAFIAWALGAVAAIVVHYQAPSYSEAIVGLIVGGCSYYLLSKALPRPVLQ